MYKGYRLQRRITLPAGILLRLHEEFDLDILITQTEISMPLRSKVTESLRTENVRIYTTVNGICIV